MHPSEHCGAWPSLTTSSQLSVSASSFLHECRHAAALAMLLNRNRPSDLGEQVDCRCGHLSHAGNRCAHALVSLSFSECFSGNVELLSIFRNFIWHPNQCLVIYIGSKMLCLVNQGSWPLPRPRSINLQGGDAVFFTLSTYSVLRKLLFYTKLYFGVNSNFLIPRPIPCPGKGAASGPPAAHALCIEFYSLFQVKLRVKFNRGGV